MKILIIYFYISCTCNMLGDFTKKLYFWLWKYLLILLFINSPLLTLLSSILLYEFTYFSLSIHLLRKLWVISSFLSVKIWSFQFFLIFTDSLCQRFECWPFWCLCSDVRVRGLSCVSLLIHGDKLPSIYCYVIFLVEVSAQIICSFKKFGCSFSYWILRVLYIGWNFL